MLEQEPTQQKRSGNSEQSIKPRRRKRRSWVFLGAGLGGLALGGVTSAFFLLSPLDKLPGLGQWLGTEGTDSELSHTQTPVLALASVSAVDRATQLETIANGKPSLDRNRARYLLAVDRIQQDHGGQALPLLEGLEKDYPVLAAEILGKRAQAYAATGETAQAIATWQDLLKQFPDSPMAAEALYHLSKTDTQYGDQLIQQFPAHPRAVEMAVNRLQQNPKQPQLLLLLARNGIYLPDISSVLDRLKTDYAAQLTPEDWQAIGFAYWEIQRYGSAAEAYVKAPPSAINLYRAARGAQLDDRGQTAIQRYQTLLQAFPKEKETGLALLNLGDLVAKPEQAITYLDQAINQFPAQAAAALSKKATLLQNTNSPKTALQLQQRILKEFSDSEAAAELRWRQAEEHMKQGNTQAAWEWAKQLVEENPTSEAAPKAAFWVGKWAAQLGKSAEAQQAYEYVLANYPESYYAWRSAVLTGWDVGDFGTVRQKLPEVVKPAQRSEPLAGSAALKELYRLGQDQESWNHWQVEFTNRVQPTVAEQFTDGLMRLGVNDNLEGIFMLASLEFREPPAERKEYQTIRQQIGYWQALYPFPYMQMIEQWAEQRQLNPMLVTALIRQESRFEPKIRSVAGATGLMQVMPDTADWVATQTNLKQYDLENPQDNINLGTWYLNHTHEEYANNSLFAVASYNAGPGNVAEWISRFGSTDPDRFVEQIPFDETRGYVEAVFGNYWNYLRLYNPEVSQKLAQASPHHSDLVSSLAE